MNGRVGSTNEPTRYQAFALGMAFIAACLVVVLADPYELEAPEQKVTAHPEDSYDSTGFPETSPPPQPPQQRPTPPQSVPPPAPSVASTPSDETHRKPPMVSEAEPVGAPDEDVTMPKPDTSTAASCESKVKQYDPLGFSVSSDLRARKVDILERNVSVHYKIEANLSTEHIFLEWRPNTRVNLAMMFTFVSHNLTFLYEYVNCPRKRQPIWMLTRPLWKLEQRIDVATFRHDLQKRPIVGKIVGHFNCTNSTLHTEAPNEVLAVSRIRIRVDVDFASHRLIVQSCPPDLSGTEFCETAFNNTVRINTNRLDFGNIRTLFFGSWPGQHFMDTRTLADYISVQTSCERLLPTEGPPTSQLPTSQRRVDL